MGGGERCGREGRGVGGGERCGRRGEVWESWLLVVGMSVGSWDMLWNTIAILLRLACCKDLLDLSNETLRPPNRIANS